MLELDAETLEALGYGEPWPSIVSLAYDLRERTLVEKRATAAIARELRLKRSTVAPCVGCGRVFDHRGSGKGWLRSYCSDACRVRFHNRKASEARATTRPGACLACGATLPSTPAKRADGRGNRPRRYCNDRCSKRAKRKKTPDRNSADS